MLSLTHIVEKMSAYPAGIPGFECGLIIGYQADITIIDPISLIPLTMLISGLLAVIPLLMTGQLRGKPVPTMGGGRIVYQFK